MREVRSPELIAELGMILRVFKEVYQGLTGVEEFQLKAEK